LCEFFGFICVMVLVFCYYVVGERVRIAKEEGETFMEGLVLELRSRS
jgi:hypothetical protein